MYIFSCDIVFYWFFGVFICSLFCSTDELEALQYLEKIRTIILPLAAACGAVFEKDIVQKVLDTHREHECWKTVHIAVEVGLHKDLESLLRNDAL